MKAVLKLSCATNHYSENSYATLFTLAMGVFSVFIEWFVQQNARDGCFTALDILC